jgi:hypothetical protein
MNTLENMPMDIFIAYKLQKRVEKGLKEERLRKALEQEPENSKIIKNDCHNCGQNWLWCICDHSILNEG